jgi:UDP-glucose 4-epimerase
MRTLVTGGAGFIGSNLVRLLLESGHSVRVLDNLSSGYKENLSDFAEVDFREGDVRDGDAVVGAVDGVEVVFHLAASVGNKRSIEHPLEDAEINVLGTIRVLEGCRWAGVRKIVYSSSAGIFGELKTLPIQEHHPVEPDSPYGASKLCGEKMCLAYDKLYGMEVACLRYFNVYGANQRYDEYGNVIPIFAERLLQGVPMIIFGDGEQTRDFVNVRDVAGANLQVASTIGAVGAFNIASGSRITINQLAEKLARAAGVEMQVVYGPDRKGDVRHSLADITRAREAFGYNPTVGLDEGLRGYVAWLRFAAMAKTKS